MLTRGFILRGTGLTAVEEIQDRFKKVVVLVVFKLRSSSTITYLS